MPISVRGTATPGFHLSSMILLTRQAGCGGGHLAPVASRLLALLAALQLCAALSAGLPQRHDPGRRALQAAAQAAQLPPQLPPPLQLLRRDLLSTLTPPRRVQRRPSRQWWDALQPLWADEFDGSVLDSSKWCERASKHVPHQAWLLSTSCRHMPLPLPPQHLPGLLTCRREYMELDGSQFGIPGQLPVLRLCSWAWRG